MTEKPPSQEINWASFVDKTKPPITVTCSYIQSPEITLLDAIKKAANDGTLSVSFDGKSPKLYSSAEAAQFVGVTRMGISRIAKRAGVGQIVGQAYVFTVDDLTAMKAATTGMRGNPAWVKKADPVSKEIPQC